jgi:hypothetical protein
MKPLHGILRPSSALLTDKIRKNKLLLIRESNHPFIIIHQIPTDGGERTALNGWDALLPSLNLRLAGPFAIETVLPLMMLQW